MQGLRFNHQHRIVATQRGIHQTDVIEGIGRGEDVPARKMRKDPRRVHRMLRAVPFDPRNADPQDPLTHFIGEKVVHLGSNILRKMFVSYLEDPWDLAADAMMEASKM